MNARPTLSSHAVSGFRRTPPPPAAPRALGPVLPENAPSVFDQARLLRLPFPEFVEKVASLLARMGYAQVDVMKPMHGRGKGRNQHGGMDIQAFLPGRSSRELVIAQVKQYKEAVPRAFVDELRGTMLRTGAGQGLLVTTSTFSPAAVEAAQAGQHAAPIRLIDGAELVRLLRTYAPSAFSRTCRTTPQKPMEGVPAAKSEDAGRSNGSGTNDIRRHSAAYDCGKKPDVLMLTLSVAIAVEPLRGPVPEGQGRAINGERR